MIKRVVHLLVPVGLLITLINGCDKNENADWLTNGSYKTWKLLKIVNPDSITIIPEPCVLDDENTFQVGGKYSIDNMGTVFTFTGLDMAPLLCKDTIDVTSAGTWTLNAQTNTLTIALKNYSLNGNIIKLTTDSLILKRFYPNAYTQTEYYTPKKQN
jgi:hypothetical protein